MGSPTRFELVARQVDVDGGGRGSMPDVPEKYRKYLEAITKQGDKRK